MTELAVATFECESCGLRFPCAIFYPKSAPHGPDGCRAVLGWRMVSEPYPPLTNEPGGYPPTPRRGLRSRRRSR